MALKAFEEFLEEPLVIPIGGKAYVVPPVDALNGVRLSDSFLAARSGNSTSDVDDETELDLYKRALGAAYDDLVADGVPFPALMRAGKTALYDFMAGRDAAENYWNTGSLSGEATPSPAEGTSTSTGAAKKTQKPASTSGTNSPKQSPSKPKPAK